MTGDIMSEHTDHLAALGQEDFELERRGYSRRQVDEFAAKARSTARDLEARLSQAFDDNERLRLELSSARQAAASRPPHEEISERVGQILKLADDEAKSQRKLAGEEIAKLRSEAKQDTDRLRAEAKQETDKFRAEAQNQAERMLRAAQEQAENSVASARSPTRISRPRPPWPAPRLRRSRFSTRPPRVRPPFTTAPSAASTCSCPGTPRPSGA